MADQHTIPSTPAVRAPEGNPVRRFLVATELDTRLLGMIGALVVIWIAFNLLSGGLFLTPRNLWNLSVQTSSIAVMSTGMVLVIVMRHIDLSVGSILAVSAVAAMLVSNIPGLGMLGIAIWEFNATE